MANTYKPTSVEEQRVLDFLKENPEFLDKHIRRKKRRSKRIACFMRMIYDQRKPDGILDDFKT